MTEFKRKIADRDWINAVGQVVGSAEEATGVRHTMLKSGNVYERQITPANSTLYAVFGAATYIGNLVSQHQDDPAAINAKLDLVDQGEWPGREAGEGPRKIDKDVMAQAVADVALAEGVDPTKVNVPAIRARLDDDSFYAKVRARALVKAKYAELIAAQGGKAGPAGVGDLL